MSDYNTGNSASTYDYNNRNSYECYDCRQTLRDSETYEAGGRNVLSESIAGQLDRFYFRLNIERTFGYNNGKRLRR